MEANCPNPRAENCLCQVVVQPSSTHALRGVVNQVRVLFDVVTGEPSECFPSLSLRHPLICFFFFFFFFPF